MAPSGKDKSAYSRLGNDYAAPTTGTPLDSRSSSPQVPLSDDQHFAYSTSLRRHEPEPAILDFGAAANAFTPTASRFSTYDVASGSGGAGGAGAAHGAFHASGGPGGYSHHPFAHTTSPLTPSSHYATQTVPQTLSALSTSVTRGLNSATVPAIRELSGPNEFEVSAKDPLWKRFAGQFSGDPLILLLLGSAVVSAFVGNFDDAASIVVAIFIVVTGSSFLPGRWT